MLENYIIHSILVPPTRMTSVTAINDDACDDVYDRKLKYTHMHTDTYANKHNNIKSMVTGTEDMLSSEEAAEIRKQLMQYRSTLSQEAMETFDGMFITYVYLYESHIFLFTCMYTCMYM